MEKPKVGDKVHVGHGSKDGVGVKGIVTKIEGDTVHIRSLKAEISDLTKKPTYKQYKGDIRNVTVESEQIDEISKDKLRDYKHKAELSEPKDDHEYINRSKGIERADKKLNRGNIVKKPYEQFIKSISEAWPGTPEYEAKFGKPKGLSGTTQGNRHDITVKGNVTRAVRRIDPATGHTAEPKQKVDIQDGPKRGRGRPPGKYGAYARKLKESLEIIESLETGEELDSYIDSLDEELVDELLAYIEESEQENLGRHKIKVTVSGPYHPDIDPKTSKVLKNKLVYIDGNIKKPEAMRQARAQIERLDKYKVHNATYLGVAEETSTLASHVSRIVDECLKARKGVSEASRGIGNDALGDYEEDEVRQLLKDKAKVQKEAEQTGSWRKETPWRKITEPDTTVDKSGAKHTMHSKVRDLARRAMNKNPNVPQKVKESLDVLITMDEQFDLDGYFYELDEDIGSSVLEALEQLEEQLEESISQYASFLTR